jgi:hypothetical protein
MTMIMIMEKFSLAKSRKSLVKGGIMKISTDNGKVNYNIVSYFSLPSLVNNIHMTLEVVQIVEGPNAAGLETSLNDALLTLSGQGKTVVDTKIRDFLNSKAKSFLRLYLVSLMH